MRLMELLHEGKFKEIDLIVKELPHLYNDIELYEDYFIIYIHFLFQGEKGVLREYIIGNSIEEKERNYRSRVIAAASAVKGQKIKSFKKAKEVLENNKVSGSAIRILTNPSHWAATLLRHGSLIVGA